MNFLYKKILLLLYSILIFFTPLISLPFFFDKYEFVKLNFFYIISSIIILVYSLDTYTNKSNYLKLKRIINTKIFRSILLFFLAYFISTIFSYNLNSSMYGNRFSYSNSFLSITYLILLSVISYSSFSKNEYLKLFLISLVSYFIVILFAIFQVITNDSTSLFRVSSSLGHPNQLAQYILLYIPFIFYITNKIKDFSKSILFLFLFLISTIVLFNTYSLSGIFTFFILLIIIIFNTKYKFRHVFRYSFILTFLLSLFLFNFDKFYFRINDFIVEIFNLLTLYSNSQFSYKLSDPLFIRVQIFSSLINLITLNIKNFLIGIGPENIYLNFSSYTSALFNYTSEWDFVVTNAHNYYVQLLTELGLIGLFTYLYFIKHLYMSSNKLFKQVFIGFFITNLFAWPVISTHLLFFILVSFILKQETDDN